MGANENLVTAPMLRGPRPDVRFADLPHSLEAEQAVLGAILVEEAAFDRVAPLVRATDFYLPCHQAVYGACEELAQESAPIDPVLVTERLAAKHQLGSEVPREVPLTLARAIGTTGNVAHYAEVIAKHARTRRIVMKAQAIVEGTISPEQAVEAMRAAADQPGGGTAIRLAGASDIFAPLPPVDWLCQLLDLAPGPPALLAGYGFCGKTVAAQDLALAVATGSSAWGTFPVRRGRVLHLDYEQGQHLTRLRYQRLARARGIDPVDLEARLALATLPGWYLDGDVHDQLTRVCEGFDLLIVDSFRAACPGTDENASDARVPLDRLTRLAETTGITTLVLHHARKPAKDAAGGARMSIRGSGALFDACGSVLVFSGEKGEPPTVTHEKARISGRPHQAFRLWIEDVEIGGDPTAGLRVSCLGPPPPKADPTRNSHADTMARIQALVREEGTVAGGVNYVRTRLGLKRDDVGPAVQELERLGVVRRGGTYHAPTLTYVGTDPDSSTGIGSSGPARSDRSPA